MKKLFLILPLLFIPFVKADSLNLFVTSEHSVSDYSISSSAVQSAITYFNSQEDYSYYVILASNNGISLFLLPTDSSYISRMNRGSGNYYSWSLCTDSPSNYKTVSFDTSGSITSSEIYSSSTSLCSNSISYVKSGSTITDLSTLNYSYYDSNFDVSITFNPDLYFNEVTLTGFYSDNISLQEGKTYPKLKDLLLSSSWVDYESQNGYTEINLDSYNYIILTLKNYNVEPFNTNFFIQGRVGITPVYNYGTVERSNITDICNINYNSYTPTPIYFLEKDLSNKAVYYVKECQQGSSIRIDSSLFNITYVDSSNEEDSTIIVDGVQYHTIPFDKLSNSANQNTANGYTPGEVTEGAGGLDSAIKNVQNKLSEIWNTFTYFTSLINSFFALLPPELSTILITAFTITIVLGLIKIFIL